jgi:DNA (cytosine-5)-methyltransferase 1
MKLGGLFSGVGGFELAWTQLGHEVAWMCEWDAKARKVLEARFPGVPSIPTCVTLTLPRLRQWTC